MTFHDALNDMALVPGTSGTGKSSFLKLLALHAIAARKSVLCIDTHYDTFPWLLHVCIACEIPPSQCVIIDLTNHDHGVVVLDPLHITGVHPYVCIDSLLAAAHGIWRDSWGERMADVMRMMFLTLQRADLPLSAAIPFLTDQAVHRLIIQKVNDGELERFWDHLGVFRKGEAAMVIESTRNKMNGFLMHPLIQPMFDRCASTIDLYNAFNAGKIILVNLSRNFFKDDSSRGFLGAIIMTMAYNALLRRENDKKKRPVAMLCDEVHEYYIPEFFNPILTGGRKYGAGLQMFTQSLGHFKPHDLEVIFSTVGSIISFGVGYADARRLVDEMFVFRNDTAIKYQQRDIYGGYGEVKHYTAGEQRQHALAELMSQVQRETMVRIKKRRGNEMFLARVSDVPEFHVTPEQEEAYRRDSAKFHAYTNP